MYAPTQGSALMALESAVALPGFYSKEEYDRALRRNHQDVTKAAMQLKSKHSWLTSNKLDNLSLARPSLQREVKKQYLQLLHDASDKCKCPIILFSVGKFHPTQSNDKLIAGKEQCTDHGGTSTLNETTSSIDDARRLIVYMVTLAIEAMEDEKSPGIVYLIDMDGVSTNLVTEGNVHLELLRTLKEYFPETVQFCFVLNYSSNVWIQQATAYLLKSLGVSERTQQKIKFIRDLRELQHYFDAPALPEKFGGLYKLMSAQEWMSIQADIEEVDLENLPAEEETTYMTKQARELNGMQYAACSVSEVVEMNTTVLRGALWRNKSGISWVKMYAVLRPDALLLYEDIKGKMPMVIIPINHEVAVVSTHFDSAPKGTFGFRIDVEGVPGGHLLAANTEKERGNWLQDIQMGIQGFEEQHARDVYEEERKIRMDSEFEKLNMIDFSTELPVNPTPAPVTAHQNVFPPAPTPFTHPTGFLAPAPVSALPATYPTPHPIQTQTNVFQHSQAQSYQHPAQSMPSLSVVNVTQPAGYNGNPSIPPQPYTGGFPSAGAAAYPQSAPPQSVYNMYPPQQQYQGQYQQQYMVQQPPRPPQNANGGMHTQQNQRPY